MQFNVMKYSSSLLTGSGSSFAQLIEKYPGFIGTMTSEVSSTLFPFYTCLLYLLSLFGEKILKWILEVCSNFSQVFQKLLFIPQISVSCHQLKKKIVIDASNTDETFNFVVSKICRFQFNQVTKEPGN